MAPWKSPPQSTLSRPSIPLPRRVEKTVVRRSVTSRRSLPPHLHAAKTLMIAAFTMRLLQDFHCAESAREKGRKHFNRTARYVRGFWRAEGSSLVRHRAAIACPAGARAEAPRVMREKVTLRGRAARFPAHLPRCAREAWMPRVLERPSLIALIADDKPLARHPRAARSGAYGVLAATSSTAGLGDGRARRLELVGAITSRQLLRP
jgi:hypothetical protein